MMYFFIFSISCMADNKIDKKYQKIISDIKEFEKKGKFIGYFDDSCNITKGKERANQAQLTSHRPAGKTRAASGAQADSLSRFTEARRRADMLPSPKQVRRRGG